MSNRFEVGDRVQITGNGFVGGHDGSPAYHDFNEGDEGEVVARPGDDPDLAWAIGHYGVKVNGFIQAVHPDHLDSATPAPLDPKSVHVGDTVTLRFKETGDVITTKAYQPEDITKPGEWVFILGWPLHRPDGTFGLAFSNFEILAIEPAPEPEWKPGHMYSADVTLHGMGGDIDRETMRLYRNQGTDVDYWLAADGRVHSDEDVTDVRPLVVIDPATVDVDALLRAYAKGDTEGLSVEPRRDGLLAALAHLGIEAP